MKNQVNGSSTKACLAVKENHKHEEHHKYPEECANMIFHQRAGFPASQLKWNDYYDTNAKKYLIPFKINANDRNFRRFLQLRIVRINNVWRNNRVPLELAFWTSKDAQGRFQRTI